MASGLNWYNERSALAALNRRKYYKVHQVLCVTVHDIISYTKYLL